MSDNRITQLEAQLDVFDAAFRAAALDELATLIDAGKLPCKPQRPWLNLHCHSFYSYNGYGFSPSRLAYLARREGFLAVGLVDFDVLDGVNEFHAAGRRLGLRTIAGMETRAFVPSFADREINSPGEPGITYHMGIGFTKGAISPGASAMARQLRESAKARNVAVIAAVNPFLMPLRLEYERDVLPLTPSGNATERHICAAYDSKAQALFPSPGKRAQFWADRLDISLEEAKAIQDNAPKLQGLIRSKTMKRGGVGYQQPDGDSFPAFTAVNDFVSELGAIPTITWLDGTSPGEQAIEELLDLHMEAGAQALNIVPDRNWNIADPDLRKTKVANLHRIVALCQERQLPIAVGTEMNAPGLKLVDDFDAPELAPLHEAFVRGAHIIFGHTVASIRDGHGYTSDWSRQHFASAAERNAWYEELGRSTTALE